MGRRRGRPVEFFERRPWLGAAVVALAALVAFSNAAPPAAVHDDRFFVPSPYELHASDLGRIFTEGAWAAVGASTSVYRPLSMLSIAVDGQVWGDDPRGYHATAILLHVAASVAVFFLLVRLLGSASTWAAMLGGALFAVHPVHSEVVNSVFNRSETLATLLVVCALLALLRWHERNAVLAWVVVAVLYFLALLSRESAVSLPVLAMLTLWFVHPAETASQRLRRMAPALLLAIPLVEYFLLRSFALSTTVQTTAPVLEEASAGLGSHLAGTVGALREYLRMMAWPWPLRVSYVDFAPSGLAWTAVVHAAVLGAGAALYRRVPMATFAIAFFYLALLPSTPLSAAVAKALQFGGLSLLKESANIASLGERIAYLPSVGMALLASLGLEALDRRSGRAAAYGLAGALVVAGIGVNVHRSTQWRSATELFAAEVRAAPHNPDGWRLYVSALFAAGRMEDAARACDESLALEGGTAQFYNNCGAAYSRIGRADEAMAAYRRAMEMGLAPLAHANIGRLYMRQGRMAEAEAEFRAAMEAEVDPARRHYRHGVLLMNFYPQRMDEARREFEAALALQPGYNAARNALMRLRR